MMEAQLAAQRPTRGRLEVSQASAQLPQVGADNGKATNCANETMNTNGQQLATRPHWRLQIGAGEPEARGAPAERRMEGELGAILQGRANLQNCDNSTTTTTTTATASPQDDSFARVDLSTREEEESNVGSGSETSQLPPSYNTATRTCEMLDPSKLYCCTTAPALHQQVSPPVPLTRHFQASFQDDQSGPSAPLADSRRQRRQQTEPPMAGAANQRPLFSWRRETIGAAPDTMDCGPFNLDANQHERQQTKSFQSCWPLGGGQREVVAGLLQSAAAASRPANLTRSVSMLPAAFGQRSQRDSSCAAAPLKERSSCAQQASDNNQNSASSWWPKREQMLARPINHVISARGSMQWQPQTNQCCTVEAATPELGGAICGLQEERAGELCMRAPACQQELDGAGLRVALGGAKLAPLANQNGATEPSKAAGPSEVSASQQRAASISDGAHFTSPRMEPSNNTNANSHDRNQHRKQTFARAQMLLRRSEENLGPSSGRKAQQQQQQAVHRKRRRHRSTSGRSSSPEGGRNRQQQQQQQQEQVFGRASSTMGRDARRKGANFADGGPRPTIGAHSWLIDSSDEQTYAAGSLLSQGAPKALCKTGSSTHLTVAVARQWQQQQRLSEQQQQSWPTHLLPNSTNLVPASATLGSARPDSRMFERDLTSSLKTNSLKMERILSREREPSKSSARGASLPSGDPTKVDVSASKQNANSGRNRVPTNHFDRHLMGFQSQPKGNPNSPDRGEQARSLVRLSALLCMVTNLVKRSPKCLKIGSSSSDLASAAYQQTLSANSISGSLSTNSANLPASYAAAASLAYSSSTSAYATGSSRLSANSNQSHSSYQQAQLTSTAAPISSSGGGGGGQHEKPISLVQIGRGAIPYAAPSTVGSSFLYSSASSGGPIQVSSLHPYEYCCYEDKIVNETKFIHEGGLEVRVGSENSATSSQSHHSLHSARNQEESTQANREAQLAPTVMSDHELISAGSEQNVGLNPAGVAAILPRVAKSAARRRWWWMSTKDLVRRPCKARSTDSDLEPEQLSALHQTGPAAARYKSLNRCKRKGGSSSTLQNVMSLAKADRVFRFRLLASVVVSCILIGLICLLIGLIYSPSASIYQRNKLNLLIDDSDYDLSWLWPQINNQFKSRGASATTSTSGSALKLLDLQSKVSLLDQIDGSLRAHLIVIEQSERLNQLQLAMSLLTNIQLANDNFIDLGQIARLLNPSAQSGQHSNRTARSSNDSINETNQPDQQQRQRALRIELNEADHDLVSLCLLSNLHWPLVKWRHQNQQSVANFLSFALPSSSTSLSGSQTLRSLLSLLVLAESVPELKFNTNLSQFVRLNSLLRSISYYIISCSYSMQTDMLRSNLRRKFCIKLTARYEQMMLLLSQLNHNHLAKLQEPSDGLLQNVAMVESRWSRNLLDFLLDRLSLLDVQILAEATLASEDPEWLAESNATQIMGEILRSDGISIAKSQRWSSGSSLFELTKLVIGENPKQTNLNFYKDPDLVVRFQQFEAENDSAWHQLLSRDLLFPWPVSKLPKIVEPNSYDLFLHPNLTTRIIHGMVKIEFKIERPTRYIVLNSDKLNINDLTLWLKTSSIDPNASKNEQGSSNSNSTGTLKSIQIRRALVNAKLEQIYIELYETIEPISRRHIGSGKSRKSGVLIDGSEGSSIDLGELPSSGEMLNANIFVINISFNKTSLSGTHQSLTDLSEEGVGFVQYGDYFAQSGSEVKTILYTKFEPSRARRLLPCFDEPQLKAKFQLNLVHEQQHQVLFNAPKRERVPYTSDGTLQMSVFEATQTLLSTYLVSFVVYDAQNIKSITSRVAQLQSSSRLQPVSALRGRQEPELKHVQVQVLAQFEYLGQAEFASQLVPQLLAFYQTHLQFPFPSDKLDLIAIPKPLPQTGESGAQVDTMENMGLIWFKAPLLLVDPNLISQNLIEQISLMISHQIAHQYFGNIVSVLDWKDSWLFESLCQYLESLALRSAQVDWKLEDQFPVSTIQETLSAEQFESPSLVDATEQPPTRSQGLSDRLNELSGSSHPDESLASKLDQQEQSTRLTEVIKMNPNVLRKNSAILHMLLFNLLPSTEAQARLLRRCLVNYGDKTMSRRQFWLQFGNQLIQEENSMDRLRLNMARLAQMLEPTTSELVNSVAMEEGDLQVIPGSSISLTRNSSHELRSPDNQLDSSERVVFVRPHSNDNEEGSPKTEPGNLQRHRSRSNRLVDNLDLVAAVWLERDGYPLVFASAYRDQIHLRQERFAFYWSNSEFKPGEEEEEPGSFLSKRFSHVNGTNLDLGARVARLRAKQFERSIQDRGHEIWPIPLMLVSKFNPKQAKFIWLDKSEMEFPLNENVAQTGQQLDYFRGDIKRGHTSSWFKLNVNQTSLVRVNYDDRNWEALTELLVKSHYSNHLLSALDRANLIDDALTLMRCGKLSVGIAMNLTLYLEVGERDFMPWMSTIRHLDQMQTLLNQNPLWHRYVLKLLQPISSVIGWKDDGPHLMRKLRRSLFNVALQYGDEKTTNKAKQEFKGWFKTGRFIVPNLEELVYIAGVRYGDQQEWLHCWQRYQQLVVHDLSGLSSGGDSNLTTDPFRQNIEGSPRMVVTDGLGVMQTGASEPNDPSLEDEKRQLLTALASTQNTWLLEQFLNYSLDPTKIQSHHLKHVVQTLGKNPVARLFLWRFVRLNWMTLMDRFGSRDELAKIGEEKRADGAGRSQILCTMILESTKHFATKLDYEEVATFFDGKRKQQHPSFAKLDWNSNIENAIQQSLLVIKSNIFWHEHIEPKLVTWLSQYNNAATR